MKFTATAIAASLLVSGAVAEKPFFTNNEINPVEGEPFELTFTGCDEGCKITLQKGPNKDSLKSIQTLASDATGGSLSVTLTNLESGDYNFYIENNEDNLNNYSKTFEYTGTATSSDSSSSSSVESASKTSSKSETSMKTSAPASTTSGSRTSSSTDASSTSDSEDSQTTSSSSGMAGAMATVAPAALAGGAFIALFM